MEVNELEVLAHLVLVLDLGLLLHDRGFQGHILGLQLVNQLLLLAELVEHVLRKLLGVVLPDTPVLGCGEEATEVEGLLPDLGDGEVGALEDSLETLEQRLGLVTPLGDVVLQGSQLLGGDLVLLLGRQFRFGVARSLFQLAHSLRDFFLGAAFLLGLAQEVGLEELVLALDLLVVLLHGFEALHELLH